MFSQEFPEPNQSLIIKLKNLGYLYFSTTKLYIIKTNYCRGCKFMLRQ